MRSAAASSNTWRGSRHRTRSKQVAAKLELSEITVKIHRGNLMRKMEAQSLADLVRMAEGLGVRDTSESRYHGRMV